MIDPTVSIPHACDSMQVAVGRSVRDVIGRLCEAGWLFRRVRSFVDISLKQIDSSRGAGLIGVEGLVGQVSYSTHH